MLHSLGFGLSHRGRFDGFLLGRKGREVDGMNGTSRTFSHAFAAETAEVKVDVSQVVFHLDGSEWACLFALAAADAGGGASLACHSTFFFVAAGDKNSTVLNAFLSKFDNAAGASLDAGTTGGAFLVVNNGETRLGVEAKGTELAGVNAVSETKAAEYASALASVDGIGEGAVSKAVIVVFSCGVGAGTVAANNGDHGVGHFGGAPKEGGHLFSDFFTTGGAFQAIHVALLYESFGHGATAGFTASPAVGAGKNLGNLIDQRIF